MEITCICCLESKSRQDVEWWPASLVHNHKPSGGYYVVLLLKATMLYWESHVNECIMAMLFTHSSLSLSPLTMHIFCLPRAISIMITQLHWESYVNECMMVMVYTLISLMILSYSPHTSSLSPHVVSITINHTVLRIMSQWMCDDNTLYTHASLSTACPSSLNSV